MGLGFSIFKPFLCFLTPQILLSFVANPNMCGPNARPASFQDQDGGSLRLWVAMVKMCVYRGWLDNNSSALRALIPLKYHKAHLTKKVLTIISLTVKKQTNTKNNPYIYQFLNIMYHTINNKDNDRAPKALFSSGAGCSGARPRTGQQRL